MTVPMPPAVLSGELRAKRDLALIAWTEYREQLLRELKLADDVLLGLKGAQRPRGPQRNPAYTNGPYMILRSWYREHPSTEITHPEAMEVAHAGGWPRQPVKDEAAVISSALSRMVHWGELRKVEGKKRGGRTVYMSLSTEEQAEQGLS